MLADAHISSLDYLCALSVTGSHFTISEVSNRLNLRFGITFKRQIEMIRESRGFVAERCRDNNYMQIAKKSVYFDQHKNYFSTCY